MTMPAKSKRQQRFFGMVHAVQQGKMKAPSKRVAEVARTISKSDADEFASTRRKGLPKKAALCEAVVGVGAMHLLKRALEELRPPKPVQQQPQPQQRPAQPPQPPQDAAHQQLRQQLQPFQPLQLFNQRPLPQNGLVNSIVRPMQQPAAEGAQA